MLPSCNISKEAAGDRLDRYAKRFEIVDKAWNGTLRHLCLRHSLGHAFRIPSLYSTAYTNMSCKIGKGHFSSAFKSAFKPDDGVSEASKLGQLAKQLFCTFDVEGNGLVDFREVLCVLSFVQEAWDAKPADMIMRWFRHYDGHVGDGLSRGDVMRVLLTLAVKPDEVAQILGTVDPVILSEALLGGPLLDAIAAASASVATIASGSKIDMYAGIPAGLHGAMGRPERRMPKATDAAAANLSGAINDQQRKNRSLSAARILSLGSAAVMNGACAGGILPRISRSRQERAGQTATATADTIIIPSASFIERARSEARAEAAASKEAEGMDEMAFMAEIRHRRERLQHERTTARLGGFTPAAMRNILARSPLLLRVIHKLRIIRAPAVVRARIIRERMAVELKQVETSFQQVCRHISMSHAMRFWKDQTTKRWFRAWVAVADNQKCRCVKIWRFRSRVCLLRWYTNMRERRLHKQRRRMAATKGCTVLQRRGFRMLKRWFAVVARLRIIQMQRASEAHRLRVLESTVNEWYDAVRSERMLKRHAAKVCSDVLLAWRRETAAAKHQKTILDTVKAVSGVDVKTMEELRHVEVASMLLRAEAEAIAAQQAMELQSFLEEAQSIMTVETSIDQEFMAARAVTKAAGAAERERVRKLRALAKHEQWLHHVRSEEASAVRGARKRARRQAALRLRRVVATVQDWTKWCQSLAVDTAMLQRDIAQGMTVFEELSKPVYEASCRAVAASASGAGDDSAVVTSDIGIQEQRAVAAAMAIVACPRGANAVRQPGSEWTVEVNAAGHPIAFLHVAGSKRVVLVQATGLERLQVAVSHLTAGCSQLAAAEELARQSLATRSKAQARASRMLGKRFRARQLQKRLLQHLREAIEQLVDPHTGEVFYLHSKTRAPLPNKPSILGAGPIRPQPDWVLRIDVASGRPYFANRIQAWRTRTDAPKGCVQCFACQSQLADRRCLGTGCDGYMYCWDCWSGYHPAGDPTYAEHHIHRLIKKRLVCTLCTTGGDATAFPWASASVEAHAFADATPPSVNDARFVAWAPPYHLVCTSCKERVPDGVEMFAF